MSYGRLFLLPVFLGDPRPELLSPELIRTAHSLKHFIVENEKTARAFLKSIGTPVPMPELAFRVLDEHTATSDLPPLLDWLLQGIDVAVMSEAGCPGVADPGSELVRLAHGKGIKVVPFAGPSSILLGLMASGLNGQRFRFVGYLPREKQERRNALKGLEKEVQKSGETQLFIETPYRNDALLEDLFTTLGGDTLLCIACDLNCSNEEIRTRSISEWKKSPFYPGKRPCVFFLGSGPAYRKS